MNKEQEKNTMKEVFWEQFPEGTEQFAFSVEENIMDVVYEKDKDDAPFLEILSAIGIAVGHILQTSCRVYSYVGEEQIKELLYDALKKSFDYYKNNSTLPNRD